MTVQELLSKGPCRHDPHRDLGLHAAQIHLWRPGAVETYIELHGEMCVAMRIFSGGHFRLDVAAGTRCQDYRIYHPDGRLAHDPYSFPLTLGELDLHLFNGGVHYELYRVCGANQIEFQGIEGTRFVVWAPNARGVSLAADFNHWNTQINPMRSCGSSGLWELFVPGVGTGEKYKFSIENADGKTSLRADPLAFAAELRPSTASLVADVNFEWQDASWLKKRSQSSRAIPMLIYELHLGSWRKGVGEFLNYRDLAIQVGEYCLEMGFTHVELLPMMEHPFDESWGYQVTGFFAVTSRFGSPQDFQFFTNHLHHLGIAVILDWVPGHFPSDDFALAHFDGTALYEHEDPKQALHPHWGTLIFNYGRKEVCNFLIASALYWIEVMHVDALRVDAVASMLYLDYGREDGEWVPNPEGGNVNFHAVEFLKHLNATVCSRAPGVLMIAEESTSYPALTQPVENGGLGFHMKWNMGWMNDTLGYFKTDPLYRTFHHSQLTFGQLYAYSERFVLPLSHDEVVHGKGSLLSKMPGDDWQKFANLRLLYSYMLCQPGKKLLFMGGEVAQWNEWNCKGELEEMLLRFPVHDGVKACFRTLNHLYRELPAFWELDFDSSGFEWVSHQDQKNSMLAYIRRGHAGAVLCIHNFAPASHAGYYIDWEGAPSGRLIFNSDALEFGGSGYSTRDLERKRGLAGVTGVCLDLPPLSTLIYVLE